MRVLARFLTLWVAAVLLGASPASAERIALVVGVSAYRNTTPLANPIRDAELMASTLESTGFRVERLMDPDLDGLKRAMLEFGRALRKDDIEAGLFYYAGHGVQVKGENYLIPVDASIESEDEVELQAVNVNDFLAVMESSKSRVKIVILDACRDNPFAGSSRGGPRGLAPVDAPKGSYIAYSTSPGAVALDGGGNNSPYTEALAAAMLEPGTPIERVFKNARVKVLEATADRQLPWETSSITGEFMFLPASGNAAEGSSPGKSETGGAKPSSEASEAREQETARLERPRPEARPSPSWPGEKCSARAKAAAGGVACVSSVLDPQFGNRYGPGNLVDGNPATAWVEGVKGDGVGEAFVIRFKAPATVSRIHVMNGYNKSGDIFGKNNRVRSFIVTTSGGDSFDVSMSDDSGWQTIELPSPVEATWIALEIGGVFRGSKYRDTAISELRIE